MDGLCCPLGSLDVLDCDAAEGQVRIHGSTAVGSMLMYKAHVATEGSVDSRCPDHYLKARWCLRVMLSLGPY